MRSGLPHPRARHGRRAAAALAAVLGALLVTAGAGAAAMTPSLEARLAQAGPDERLPVIATLARQVDEGLHEGRPAALLRALRATAARTQPEVAEAVDAPVRRFWLVNAIAFRGTPAEVREVAADPEVAEVDLDRAVRLADGGRAAASPFPTPGDGNWGLAATGVPEVWSALGLRGAGITVGSIDTGVDAGHPALAGRIAGWRDFIAGAPAPYDDNGHGSHTAGTIAGAPAGGAPVGVAPEARLLVAKAMDSAGVGPGSALLAAGQWLADPDGDPATPDQPQVINNSWSSSGANDTWYRPMVRRWIELGIVPVFAAGNNGPSGTVTSPAGYPEAVAVGATGAADALASFSARGPVVWKDLDGLGPAAGTVLAKPDLVAPGVGITSTVPGGYLQYSGTSMAAPHVAGVAALMRQARPDLGPQEAAEILRRTAADRGPAGYDPGYGAGRLDALAAVSAALGPVPETTFTLTPPPATREREPLYAVALTGADRVRWRVDGGAWSEPSAETTRAFALAEGRHVVEAQAVSPEGVPDPTPAVHRVTVDRTPPDVRVSVRRDGTRAIFTGRVRDRLSGTAPRSVRWSFGDGTGAGRLRVVRRFAEARTRRVVLVARDRAGNERAVVRRFRPRAASAVRGVTVRPAASRRVRTLTVRGRLVRPAGVRVTLRPVRPSAAARRMGLTARDRERAGRPVARTGLPHRARGGFSLRVPIAGLRPGLYRVEVRAPERGTGNGALTAVRRVRILG